MVSSLDKNAKKKNIGILAFSIGKSGNTPISNFIDILSPISNNLYLITGNNGYNLYCHDSRIKTYGFNHSSGKNFITIILRYIYTQLLISYKIFKLYKNIDIWVFFIGGDTLIFPMIAAKLCRQKAILCIAGSSTEVLKSDNNFLSKPMSILSQINLLLSDNIILYSNSLIKKWNLTKYKHKIIIAPRHFINFDIFKIEKNINVKHDLIAYIGRFENEKGIIEFLNSIPNIIKKNNGLKFILIGDGILKEQVEDFIVKNNLRNKVILKGWVSHFDLPYYLNQIKLVVIPSYTEGLPNVMLEALACGTLVLATPVGSIPDIIIDQKTGFIMKDNFPFTIEQNVFRALNYPYLERIVAESNLLVKKEFSYQAALKRYKTIINNLGLED